MLLQLKEILKTSLESSAVLKKSFQNFLFLKLKLKIL